MSLSRKTVLVTGGAGFIGSHTCKALYKAGFLPITYDNLSNGNLHSVKWGPIEIGDILDKSRLSEVISKYKPVALIHFAAFAYVGESILDPIKYYKNNFVGSLILFESLIKFKIKNIIFSSSCSTYGIAKKIPIIESDEQSPINPYGNSKLMVEKLIFDLQRIYPIKSIILRYFNAAGADLEGELGENHNPETHIIPLLLKVASGKVKKFTIFGDDYDTHDGTCIRDYIHVTDIANAHVSSLNALIEGHNSEVFNIGSGMGHSILELVNKVESITGKKLTLEFQSKRDGDPPVLICDASKFVNAMNWRADNSAIDNIIRTAWQWENRIIEENII